MPSPQLSNLEIAEFLALEAEVSEGDRARALRRGARLALTWEVEVADLVQGGRPLTDLPGVGPSLSRRIAAWMTRGEPPPPPPPLRAHFRTLTQVCARLDAAPDWRARLGGDLQCHTTWSDGGDSVAAMAAGAEARGYEFLAISDHSQGLKIAGGIDEAALARQWSEIEAVNQDLAERGSRVRLLKSMELNLGLDGSGDMDDAALRGLDLVVGSFHSRLRLKEDQTQRYLGALRNPRVQVLGHPRGRIWNYRQGLSADWEQVFAEALALNKAVETDGLPDRQDLDVPTLELARQSGVLISLGSDSHAADQLHLLDFALAAVLEAGIDPQRVINFWPRQQLLEWSRSLNQA